MQCLTLSEKCLCMEFFWSIFSPIRGEYGHLLRKSLYSFRMQQNKDQKNSKDGHFSGSVRNGMQPSWSGYKIFYCITKSFKIDGLDFFANHVIPIFCFIAKSFTIFHCNCCKLLKIINPFDATGLFLHPMKGLKWINRKGNICTSWVHLSCNIPFQSRSWCYVKFLMPFVSLFIWFLFFVRCFSFFLFYDLYFFIFILNVWLTW